MSRTPSRPIDSDTALVATSTDAPRRRRQDRSTIMMMPYPAGPVANIVGQGDDRQAHLSDSLVPAGTVAPELNSQESERSRQFLVAMLARHMSGVRVVNARCPSVTETPLPVHTVGAGVGVSQQYAADCLSTYGAAWSRQELADGAVTICFLMHALRQTQVDGSSRLLVRSATQVSSQGQMASRAIELYSRQRSGGRSRMARQITLDTFSQGQRRGRIRRFDVFEGRVSVRREEQRETYGETTAPEGFEPRKRRRR